MAENTTKDIWNDDDGDRAEPKKRRHLLRNFLIFLLVLIVVLGIVLAAAWRDGTGFDALRRYFAYGSSAVSSEKTVYQFDTDNSNRFAEMGDGYLVILSDTALRMLGADGNEIWSANVQMTAPALVQGGGKIAAYDVGGTAVYVLDENGEQMELTAEGPIVSASLNSSGMLAVTSQVSGTKGRVDVYTADGSALAEVNAHRRFVADACVTEDGKSLSVVLMGQEDGTFVSDVSFYDLTRPGEAEVTADYVVQDGLVTAMGCHGSSILTVTDTCFASGRANGKLTGTYSYDGEYLREYDLGGDGFTALLLNRYQSGSVGRLVTVDDEGAEIASLDISEEVRSLSANGRYLSVLYEDRLVVYNSDLEIYATLHGPEHTREVLTRTDGSVLMIASDSAQLFLP